MPYDWRTGAYVPTLPGYGPRTPNLVGVGATAAPPKRPAYPTMAVGPNGQRVPYDPSIYKKRPPVKQTIPGPKKPVDPYAQWIQMAMGAIETPAQQEARINREIDRQIAASKKLMDDEYAKQRADALAAYQAQSLAGAAAAAMNKDLFGAVGGEFNAGAKEIKGLSHGLTGATGALTSGDIAAANTGLGAGNVPVAADGSALAPGGATQVGVEDYRAGGLGSQMLGTQGEAANFGLAGLIASGNLAAVQGADAALINARRDINASHAKAIDALAANRLDLYHTYMNEAKDNQIKYISLAQGLMAAKQAGATGTKPITQRIGNTLYQYDPAKGRWVKVAQGDATATKPTTKTVGGSLYQYNPAKNRWELAIEAPPNMDVPHTKVMGNRTYQWDPNTRSWVDIGPKPGTAGGTGTKGKKLPTPGQTQKMVEGWFYGKDDTELRKMPKTDARGNPVYRRVPGGKKGQLDYQSALRSLKALGYTEQQARSYLDPLYGRGDRGRPYLNAVQRKALQKAGIDKNAHVLPQYTQPNGKTSWIGPSKQIVGGLTEAQANQVTSRYLTPKQVEALQAAGMLPPGLWVPGSGLKDARGYNLTRVYLISHVG